MVRVCFVCLGNICRSPTAAGVMQHLVDEAGLSDRIEVDSAGTSRYHIGEPPDPRSVAAARARGVRVTGLARAVTARDFEQFDFLLAADQSNLRELRARAPRGSRAEIQLIRSFDPVAPPNAEVPDPYYGGEGGFAEVLDLCEAACRGLLDRIRTDYPDWS